MTDDITIDDDKFSIDIPDRFALKDVPEKEAEEEKISRIDRLINEILDELTRLQK